MLPRRSGICWRSNPKFPLGCLLGGSATEYSEDLVPTTAPSAVRGKGERARERGRERERERKRGRESDRKRERKRQRERERERDLPLTVLRVLRPYPHKLLSHPLHRRGAAFSQEEVCVRLSTLTYIRERGRRCALALRRIQRVARHGRWRTRTRSEPRCDNSAVVQSRHRYCPLNPLPPSAPGPQPRTSTALQCA